MYTVSVQAHFDSAHFLRKYKGKCERLHGHRYVVEAAVRTEELNESGIAFDFVELKGHLRELADELDHRNLNLEVPWMDGIMPSTENFVVAIWDRLGGALPDGVSLCRIVLRETENNSVEYVGPDSPDAR